MTGAPALPGFDSDPPLAVCAARLARAGARLLGLRAVLAVLVVGVALLGGGPRAVGLAAALAGAAVLVAAAGLATRRARGAAGAGGLVLPLADVVLATAGAALTGGARSPCVLLFALPVVCAGRRARQEHGVLLGAAGAVAVAALASFGPWPAGEPRWPSALALVALEGTAVVAAGVLAGRLGARGAERDRELAETRRRLTSAILHADTIIEHMSSGLVAVTRGGRIRHMNRAAASILGLAAETARGHGYRSVLANGLAPLGGVFERALVTGLAESRTEIELTQGDRTFPAGVSTSILRDGEGRAAGALAIFQDLTRAREQEEAARRQQTLAAIGELTAGIVHEIRNALHPISGSVDVLRRELKPTGDNAALLDLVALECERLHRFIGDLLAYGRQKQLAAESLDLTEVVRTVAQEVRHHPAMREGLTIHVDVPDTPIAVRGDPEALRQVFVNLCVNGLEATRGSGVLTLRALRAPGDRAEVLVEDEGIGIPHGDREHIFEPFFTTKNGGTGLGLAIALRIVESHAGLLSAVGRSGRGTTMRVSLPEDPAATDDHAVTERVA